MNNQQIDERSSNESNINSKRDQRPPPPSKLLIGYEKENPAELHEESNEINMTLIEPHNFGVVTIHAVNSEYTSDDPYSELQREILICQSYISSHE